MFQTAATIAVALLGAAAGAVDSPYYGRPVPSRPEIRAWPLSPGTPHAISPPRNPDKYCFVKPSCKSDDDAPNILAAFQKCNHGGTVVLDATYTIGSPLDLTFLDSVDVVLSGTVKFSTDINYWVANSFKYAYQTSIAFWRFGGRDVNIYGGGVGTLDGSGQVWYDAFAANASLLRPILFVLDGLHGGSVTDLHMINSPDVRFFLRFFFPCSPSVSTLATNLECYQWFNFIANSSDVIVSDITLNAAVSFPWAVPVSIGHQSSGVEV